MKNLVRKVVFAWVVVLAFCAFMLVYFSFPAKARADESSIDYQRQVIIYLCDENAEMSKTLDDLIGINKISAKARTLILPTSHFFKLVKEMAMADEQGCGYEEIIRQLFNDNLNLGLALKYKINMAERIK